jgi:hypothetical protein
MRDATASTVGARRACLASAPVASAAIATNATTAQDLTRCITVEDCAIVDRFTMPCPG